MTKDLSEFCETCAINAIHPQAITLAKNTMINEDILNNMAELFKMFGDSTRLKILCALMQTEMCVCDLATLLNMSHSSISHQLRILKANKLVKNRKDGKIVYYSLNDDHIEYIFNQGLNHITE